MREKQADDRARRLFERGEFLDVAPRTEREAIEQVRRRYRARRETVASLGKELGVLRRAHGLTQEQVAAALGTKKSNISRLESGRYGGLTIEYFMAVIDVFRLLDGASTSDTPQRRMGSRRTPPNKRLQPTAAGEAVSRRG